MKIIYRGEVYDSLTAKCIGVQTDKSDDCTERLYMTDSGKYFITFTCGGGSDILPISEEKAKMWTQGHMYLDIMRIMRTGQA